MTFLLRSLVLSLTLLQVHSLLYSAEFTDGFITAVSDWARYRTHVEALAQKAKVRYPVNSAEYDRARNSYNQLVQSSSTFNASLQELLKDSNSTATSASAATRAGSVGEQFVREISPSVNQQSDRMLFALIPPFVQVLTAVIQLAHSKKTKAQATKTIQRELVWTPWNNL